MIIAYFSSNSKFLALLSVKGRTREKAILSVVECLQNKGIDFSKLVSINTDGGANMTGKDKVFINRIKQYVEHDV